MQVQSFSGAILPEQKKEYEVSKLTYHSDNNWKNEHLSWMQGRESARGSILSYDVLDCDS